MNIASSFNPAGNLNQGCWKRRRSEGDHEDEPPKAKRQGPFYIILAKESPHNSSDSEDPESTHSFQANETDRVRDTSDLSDTSNSSGNSWATSMDSDVVDEFEPASLSENENPFIDALTSSDPEDIIIMALSPPSLCLSDVGLADSSDNSVTSLDSELNPADYWSCIQCKNSNNNPSFRYCEKCYETRKHFLPPRPRKRKKRRRRKSSKKNSKAKIPVDEGRELLTTVDSGLGLSSGSQPTLSFELCSNPVEIGESSSTTYSLSQPSASSSSQDTAQIAKTDDEEEQRTLASQESQSSIATTVSINDENFPLSDTSEENDTTETQLELPKNRRTDDTLCVVCTLRPKDAAILHGRNVHICCCYHCGMKVWKTTKHCPICKRKVRDVLKVYYA